MSQPSLSSLIWQIADLLRGPYKRSQYGSVILPFTVLRRLDCALASTKREVLAAWDEAMEMGIDPDVFARRASAYDFYNRNALDLAAVLGDQDNIAANLAAYVEGFSPEVADIFERFRFAATVEDLAAKNLLYLVTEKFAGFDLHPDRVSNAQMGQVFEELIRRFAEASNDEAGEHFTPREVIRLMVNLVFAEDDAALSRPGTVRTVYDPTAGTGGMLSVADEHLSELNPDARLVMFGQELNDFSYAICKADMLIKGQDVTRIVAGNTLDADGHGGQRFDYMLANPPFGREWKAEQKAVKREHEEEGASGRFGPGLPRVSDGSLLFLMHLLSKMRLKKDGGSRIAIVLNGSPLFTGGAGSGESEIRRHVLENDLVEAIVALPTDMFYNTGIATYVWVLSNVKPDHRRGVVQLIDGSSMWRKMRKSLGSKRRELGENDIETITQLFGEAKPADLVTDANGNAKVEFLIGNEEVERSNLSGSTRRPVSLVLPNSAFGYRQITVERPLMDGSGRPVTTARGKLKPDPARRDTETVPLAEDVEAYFEREVRPHAPDAWIDETKTRIGYEIPFNRHFYVFEPPRDLAQIDRDLAEVTGRIQTMLAQMSDEAAEVLRDAAE